jgi:endothelin-converting enzyme
VVEKDQQEITEMIKAMRTQLYDTFEAQDWLDDKTKKAAAKKLTAMKFHVGYPDLLLDDQFLSEYFQGLDLSKKSLVQICEQIARNKNKIQRKILREPIAANKEILFLTEHAKYIPSPNALYHPNYNTFMICAGIMYSDAFSVDRPVSMNYGNTGTTIGHEILHGFDSNGRLFDENGHFKNWWGKEAEKKFIEKSKCFIDQYGRYVEPVTGMRLNGVKTLAENIADNGGLLLAYNTFKNNHKFDQILPNTNFTSNQLLWLSSAQFYCNNFIYQKIKKLIETDSHTISRFRVIGTVGNLKEFSNDFQCPEGSNMNRKNKCKIW